jgi:hypothetical protein
MFINYVGKEHYDECLDSAPEVEFNQFSAHLSKLGFRIFNRVAFYSKSTAPNHISRVARE